MFKLLIFIWLFGFIGALITYVISANNNNTTLQRVSVTLLIAGLIGCLGSCSTACNSPRDYSNHKSKDKGYWGDDGYYHPSESERQEILEETRKYLETQGY